MVCKGSVNVSTGSEICGEKEESKGSKRRTRAGKIKVMKWKRGEGV